MLKISGLDGLDKLSKDMQEAQDAFASLNGELGTVTFNAEDPESIEEAIRELELKIDERLDPYSSNPIVGPMIADLKETYRDAVLQRASEARLQNDGGEDGLVSSGN